MMKRERLLILSFINKAERSFLLSLILPKEVINHNELERGLEGRMNELDLD